MAMRIGDKELDNGIGDNSPHDNVHAAKGTHNIALGSITDAVNTQNMYSSLYDGKDTNCLGADRKGGQGKSMIAFFHHAQSELHIP